MKVQVLYRAITECGYYSSVITCGDGVYYWRRTKITPNPDYDYHWAAVVKGELDYTNEESMVFREADDSLPAFLWLLMRQHAGHNLKQKCKERLLHKPEDIYEVEISDEMWQMYVDYANAEEAEHDRRLEMEEA